jgi:hypothetical protein
MTAQLRLWWPAAVVLALALVARYLWIEPPQFRVLCDPVGGMPWWCWAREALIFTFAFQGLGYAALMLGVASVLIRRRGIALVAVCVSLAGLVLYCFEFSAVGLLLGVLTFARLAQTAQPPVGPEHGGAQQKA